MIIHLLLSLLFRFCFCFILCFCVFTGVVAVCPFLSLRPPFPLRLHLPTLFAVKKVLLLVLPPSSFPLLFGNRGVHTRAATVPPRGRLRRRGVFVSDCKRKVSVPCAQSGREAECGDWGNSLPFREHEHVLVPPLRLNRHVLYLFFGIQNVDAATQVVRPQIKL